jgi:hypothetical protein
MQSCQHLTSPHRVRAITPARTGSKPIARTGPAPFDGHPRSGELGLREDVHRHGGCGKEASEAAAGVHAGPATSDAHACRSCDAGVAPATSSEHRTPACDPTVAANRRQRTQSGGRPRQPGNVRRTRTPIVRRRRHPGNLQRTQNASVRPHRRRQPPPAHTNHPSVLPCRYSTPDQIHDLRYADKGIAAHSCPAVPHPCCPAVPHRCQNAAETAVQHSRKDSAVAPRCLNGAGTAMPRSQRRSAARNAPTGTNRNISITFIRFAPPRRSML